ncbi:tRNA (N6-threonylcarbamoyladenosine(37)-N6)-methyltransferase TrmO [Chromobacterium subtsugae]|uniref:tRNA (N6-threonylcarbamoyladenosine(37)-N6)-methyltransferase TrmO n=1 Tax=Chromobacterium subtsugae TaxID=251747 RepID=A0ABS7FE82_9NEIS|nr:MULTISPECIES: tRNA (N6-threonylcarbamoyladenosine(37)-N6)-methyltransferase TrmO [Chromobacterium]KUM05204.1 tRNA-Thr(GGU) m(6)t(6)A37 methyltransferase TsaA [Chromobacterium subtsugae]KZE83655.1 tRNA-Thr(GGU) m(6)t(6)A37 methyltransferase TsaA [Chromobacterium sp. F49]MBW7566692.1 tRNA (N6-threonylcarbamoyladenosine(37)-N6)-methyltransferase TrmO [Chromobacterium subtsugae]MBW8288375.1 tRNA (N6-threonylcarbamoyladenosine(37)-N6)-methyltransferase TrmO [Chromobacterium subtsugae]WSE92268.1 
MTYAFEAVGVIRSPYREKFGIPRQPSLVNAARVTLELLPPYNHPDCVRGLSEFSHVWISFIFHQTMARGWQPLVRPPRLGGNAKVGVFASRATHRPNPLGLSLVELAGVECGNGVRLHLAGADLLDGTPVVDIKPYIPFVESRPQARGGFVDGPPPQLTVRWSEQALRQLAALAAPPDLALLVEQVLAQDPRPAYQDDPGRVYGVSLYCYNIRFGIREDIATVLEIIE